MMTIDNAQESARYGNLARVASEFYVSTGNPAELQAAVCYSRAAAYFANRHLGDPRHIGDPLRVEYTSSETAYGRTVDYGFAVKVF